MQFEFYQQSMRGSRPSNQDRMGVMHTREAALFVVCDGLGGHAGGELAAEAVVQTLGRLFEFAARPRLPRPGVFLREAIVHCHRALTLVAEKQGLDSVPRTTVVACVVQDQRASWAHVGDSRLYWLRQGQLLDRTRDHTVADGGGFAQRWLLQGWRNPPARHRVQQCLGQPRAPKVEVSERQTLVPGDRLLLCSDGFWDHLTEPELARGACLASPRDALPPLVNLALERGGESADNTTALLVSWEPDRALRPDATPTLRGYTTVELPLPRAWASGLSESDIELAIRDINERIRQTKEER